MSFVIDDTVSGLDPDSHHFPCTFSSTFDPMPDLWEVPSYIHYSHENYQPGTTEYNDIALLKISAYSKYPPVRLQTPALSSLTEPGTTVIASGWGATVRVVADR